MNRESCNISIRTNQDPEEFKIRWGKLLNDLGELNGSKMDQTYLGEIYGLPGVIIIDYPFMCNLPEEALSFLYDAYGENNVIINEN